MALMKNQIQKTTGLFTQIIVAIVFLASVAEAGPIGPCAPLRSFFLNFQTSGDDLPGNSANPISP